MKKGFLASHLFCDTAWEWVVSELRPARGIVFQRMLAPLPMLLLFGRLQGQGYGPLPVALLRSRPASL
eukprot:1003937-Pyramimonas_sp.AAC.1